jgi:hypothetical protein
VHAPQRWNGRTEARPGSPVAQGVARLSSHASSAFASSQATGLKGDAVKRPGDCSSVEPFDLRVTTTFRRENGEWKIVDRHADPISTDDRKLHEMAPDNWDEAEADVASLSAHIDDPTDSGRGEVADPLGPFISTTAEAPRRFGQRRAHGETRRLTQLISRRLRQTTGYGRG